MFKLVILTALLAIAAARPWTSDSSSLVYSGPILQDRVISKLGAVETSFDGFNAYAASPVLRSYSTSPLLRAVHAPLLKTYAASSPLQYTYTTTPEIAYQSAPLVYGGY